MSNAIGLLHAFVLDGRGGAQPLDWDGVARWSPDDGVLWLALDYNFPDAADWLAHRSGIDPLVRDALLDVDPRPRAIAHGENLMLIVRGINQNQGSNPDDMISIRVWVEPRRIVMMRHRVSRSLEALAASVAAGHGPRDTGQLVAELVEHVVEHVVHRVDLLGDAIAGFEDQLLSEARRDLRTLRAALADHRRRAIALRRFLAPQRDALAQLAHLAQPWFDPSHRARVVEQADRLTRTVEELDAARDRAGVTQEELASRLTEMTNQRLYVLSIITVIFVPLGFVCSLLGVNVGGVPYKDTDWAFWALCGLFALGTALLLWILRRKGWLGRR
ncbi:MAG TPA: zinc transporter ZntB [Kofleriaceae bacterium]|nr:zinc transporter ZntB [Kofleriaceae bacterium]